jgi:hypothetical protein
MIGHRREDAIRAYPLIQHGCNEHSCISSSNSREMLDKSKSQRWRERTLVIGELNLRVAKIVGQ